MKASNKTSNKKAKKITSYWEQFFNLKECEEFAEQLKEDENVQNVRIAKTGEGWLIEWEE